ncbi:unnamed protein product [Pedinophyceae sp. YPF-701]|nr:unnamed protein product [Pedinophyceae sp. YPF-701]
MASTCAGSQLQCRRASRIPAGYTSGFVQTRRLARAGRRQAVVRAELSREAAQAERRRDIKYRLFRLASTTNRGRVCPPPKRDEIIGLTQQLVGLREETVTVMGSPALAEGRWVLVYSSVDPLRSSPMFWALQSGLAGDSNVAQQALSLIASLPGIEIGAITSDVSLGDGQLVSSVELSTFPGIRGKLVTVSYCTASPPRTLALTVQRTTIEGANFLAPILDGVALPVRSLIEIVRGEGRADVALETDYVDSEIMVCRAVPEGAVFVYQRAR